MSPNFLGISFKIPSSTQTPRGSLNLTFRADLADLAALPMSRSPRLFWKQARGLEGDPDSQLQLLPWDEKTPDMSGPARSQSVFKLLLKANEAKSELRHSFCSFQMAPFSPSS